MLAGRRTWLAGAAVLGLALAGCTAGTDGSRIQPDSPPTPTTGSPSAGGPDGVDAVPSSTALPVEGRDMRLVRFGSDELALQFEFFNGTDQPLRPDELGIDEIERTLLLADLPRRTTYQMLTTKGLDGRISESNDERVAPNGSVTVTAVFTAPPAEATALLVMVNGLLPVEVPVQPDGSPALLDDPVLRGATEPAPFVSPLICAIGGPADDTGQAAVEIRLPSDVLFAFGSAELSPAAQEAIAAVDAQITGSGGAITVEGHTDSVGDDASNQQLSDQRAEAVRAALSAELGGSFTYQTTGFGESRPVAPNTNPDGSDNSDGRAQNRRVEIRTGATSVVKPALEPLAPTTDLSEAGLRVTVDDLERTAGFVMSAVTVRNPTSTAIELGPGSGLTPRQGEPEGLTLADRTNQRRHELCHIPSRRIGFYYLANPSSDYEPTTGGSVPAGAEVVFWGIYSAPAAGVTSMDVEVGGFGTTAPTPLRPE